MLCAQARGGPDQASTRHEELSSQKDLCHVVSWPGGGTTWGGEWGGLGEGWVSDMGLKKKKKKKNPGGGWKINVQCLTGPLLRVMESEMSRKAARIRSKDLSDRDDTSSEVIPFVSIFGRIFNLMTPAGAKKPKKTLESGVSGNIKLLFSCYCHLTLHKLKS